MIHRAAVVEADERLQHDLLQRRRALERGQRRPGRHDEDVRVAEELDGLVRAARDRERPEREVELAALDHLEQLALVLRLAEDDLDVRVALGEAAQQAGDDLRADALERPDAEPPGVAGLERAMSALAARSRAWIASACRSRICPASVSEIGRGPPGRSMSRRPTMRSSVAICCEIADCV